MNHASLLHLAVKQILFFFDVFFFTEKGQTFPASPYFMCVQFMCHFEQLHTFAPGNCTAQRLLHCQPLCNRRTYLSHTLTVVITETEVLYAHTVNKMINKSLELHSFPLVSNLGNMLIGETSHVIIRSNLVFSHFFFLASFHLFFL